MKRHIKLFEEFGSNEPKKYFVVSHMTDGKIYGVFDDEAEAMSTYNEYAEDMKGGYDEDEYDDIEQEEVDIKEFVLSDRNQIEDIFSCAVNWGDKEIVEYMISIGADPMLYFNSTEQILSFFDGDLSWLPGMPEGPMKDKLKRIQQEEDLFGSDF